MTRKSNTALAKSPTKVARTQSNHIFMSLYEAAKLEGLSIKRKMNTFALKSRLYIKLVSPGFSCGPKPKRRRVNILLIGGTLPICRLCIKIRNEIRALK